MRRAQPGCDVAPRRGTPARTRRSRGRRCGGERPTAMDDLLLNCPDRKGELGRVGLVLCALLLLLMNV
jgi:hypothetical protein